MDMYLSDTAGYFLPYRLVYLNIHLIFYKFNHVLFNECLLISNFLEILEFNLVFT